MRFAAGVAYHPGPMPAATTAPPKDAPAAPSAPDDGPTEQPSRSESSSAQFDPLGDTVRPTAADLAVTRRLSRPGARRAEPRPADPPGYRLRHLIGRGGFGAVWLATESATGKQVAVKTFRHVRALDWPLLTREVEKLAALDASRHVVQLLGVGWEADPPYYVMEYLPDGSLADLLAKPAPDGAPLPAARAAELAEGIAAGLVHAHGSGILHCDLKPGNVLLDRDGVPRLCDFGQARGVAGTGHGSAGGTGAGSGADSGAESKAGGRPLGTLFYMPPEQAAPDAAPDARWDVYALGAVLYEMLIGVPPHRTDELDRRLRRCPPAERLEAYRRAVEAAPAPIAHHHRPGVDSALARVVDRCLAPAPADRFPNAQAVRTALTNRDREIARRSRARWTVLGPAIVAALLIPVGAAVSDRTADAARHQVLTRALDANTLSARVVALSLEREVGAKREELEELAARPELRSLMKTAISADWFPGPERTALWEYLDGETTVQSGDDAPTEDTSWFLTDADGVQRWRDPSAAKTLGMSFRHKDYYHGRGVQFDPPESAPAGLGPIAETHVSLPFLSDATGRMMIAISTPVRDERGRTIGLLARTLHLDVLLAEYDVTKRGIEAAGEGTAELRSIPRVIALYERRTGELLDHPWLDRRPNVTAAEKAAAALPAEEQTALAALKEHGGPGFRTLSHLDPVARAPGGARYAGRWVAAFYPVGGTDWVAVVQERRDDALAPIESLWKWPRLIGLAVAGAVLAGLATAWFWLSRDRSSA